MRRTALLALTLGILACDSSIAGDGGDVARLELAAESAFLAIGGTMQLTASPMDARGNLVAADVQWSSSDAAIVHVSATGLITGVKEGTATITAASDVHRATTMIRVADAGSLTRLVNFDAAGNQFARFDVDGNAIDLHGGEIRYFEGTYYWYGEHYACGFQWITPGAPFCGFRVYSSPNLVDWTDRGLLFPINSQWQAWCDGRTNGCFRPHVVYNPNTSSYVLWINAYDAQGGFWVFEASSPAGEFVRVPHPELAVGTRPNLGDANLFVDRDGRGYIAYTHWLPGGDIVIEELRSDFQSGSGRHVVLGLTNVEAPTLFERNGTYYLTVSDPNCGYCRTGTSYMTASSPLGPWSERRRITETSCGGQPTHVADLPAAGGGRWFLYMSDLWNHKELNQATAGQYWAPLAFDTAGAIAAITCAPAPMAPVLVSGASPAPATRHYRLLCDIGVDGGRHQRELRFATTSARRLRAVRINLFQRGARNSPEGGSPNVPLVAELRLDGRVVGRAEVAPADVAWSARELDIAFDVDLEANRTYALRLHASPDRGCYGVAYRDDLGVPSMQSFSSRDRGVSWTAEASRTVKAALLFEAP